MNSNDKPFKPVRLLAVFAFFIFCSLVVSGRLLQFQVFQHEKISALADVIGVEKRPVLPTRGIIYDRHMEALAVSVTVKTVIAEPRRIKNIRMAADTLASILELDPEELMHRMSDPSHRKYLVVKRRIDPAVASYIQSLGIDGLYMEDEGVRVYPHRNLASHTLGFVNMAGEGVAGLELQYENELRGKEGLAVYKTDALGRSYGKQVIKAPKAANSIVLSIDSSIQSLAQRELTSGVETQRAAAGVAIVMESDTGRILALANYPDFNCNRYGEYPSKVWRNRAVQDQYEPGSTLKVVTASAALEEKLVKLHETIDCQMGSIILGGHPFHDHKPYGLLTFEEVIENSSNVGAIKLGMRLGKEGLYRWLCSFGFGSSTGVDLPAEAEGYLRKPEDWSALSIGSISFGHEISVTSMQILSAVNTIATGGYKLCPFITNRIVDEKGEVVYRHEPERVRVMSSETAAAMQNILEGVVLNGTGTRALLQGYRSAGKTGTAQKIENGRFSKTKYVASFVGFAPLPDPRITILVLIDEPKDAIYGGDVAAPVFRKIARETLLNLQVPAVVSRGSLETG
jgi:cell division protein FtsI (penicillin-binding protein 3)